MSALHAHLTKQPEGWALYASITPDAQTSQMPCPDIAPVSLLPPLPTPALPVERQDAPLPWFLKSGGKCAAAALPALYRQALGWIALAAPNRDPDDWPLLFLPATQFVLKQNLLFPPPLDWSVAAPYVRRVLAVEPLPRSLRCCEPDLLRHLLHCALRWTVGKGSSAHERSRLARIAAGGEVP